MAEYEKGLDFTHCEEKVSRYVAMSRTLLFLSGARTIDTSVPPPLMWLIATAVRPPGCLAALRTATGALHACQVQDQACGLSAWVRELQPWALRCLHAPPWSSPSSSPCRYSSRMSPPRFSPWSLPPAIGQWPGLYRAPRRPSCSRLAPLQATTRSWP